MSRRTLYAADAGRPMRASTARRIATALGLSVADVARFFAVEPEGVS